MVKQIRIALVTVFIAACDVHNVSREDSIKDKQAGYKSSSLVDQAYSIKDRISCEAKGGHWKPVGKLQKNACVLPTIDAGKPCTDSSQCQVSCIVLDKNLSPGQKVVGQCNESTNQFGCHTYVNDGVVEGTMCAD